MTSVDKLYGEFWAGDSALEAELETSLGPRGTDWLFEAFAALGPQPGQLVVDIGARDAVHTIRLVKAHGLKAIAVDPVPLHAELARKAIAAAGVSDDVEVVEAGIEQLPIPDGAADWIWCRDVLVHVDLARGLAECARVLRPGGRMLAYVTCATAALEPREREELFAGLAIVPESTDPETIESRANEAGLKLESRTQLAGEWRERMIEDGSWDAGADLLRLSRLQRREDEAVQRHGQAQVDAFTAGTRWGIYQLLGKTCPTVYVWRRDA